MKKIKSQIKLISGKTVAKTLTGTAFTAFTGNPLAGAFLTNAASEVVDSVAACFDEEHSDDQTQFHTFINGIHQLIIEAIMEAHLSEETMDYIEVELLSVLNMIPIPAEKCLSNELGDYLCTSYCEKAEVSSAPEIEQVLRIYAPKYQRMFWAAYSEEPTLANAVINKFTKVDEKFNEYDERLDKLEEERDIVLNYDQEYPRFYKKYPYKMTEHFMGRDNIITSAMDTIIAGRPVLLHGIGGIGKTEIAKAILNRIMSIPCLEHGIQHILWVHYSENNFARSLVEAMDLDSSAHDMDRKFQEALDVINQFGDKILMVIDNVETEKDPVLLQVTQYLKCRILVTSRENSFGDFTCISVPAMELEDCVQLFYSYYNNTHDDITLKKILTLADNHTVTVELLAKIADAEEALLHEFYKELVRCGFQISDEEAITSHEKMQAEGRIIVQLQKLFSMYGFSPSEDQLLTQISTIPSISFQFKQAKRWFTLKNRTDLNNLARRGWIKKESIHDSGRSHYQYIMHSVIASAIREQRKNILYDSCESFIREITCDMQQITEKTDFEKKKLIQFSWSINDIFKDDFHSEKDGDFLWALAEIYRDIGYYERALPIIELVKALYIKLYGTDCIQLASAWNSYGLIHYELSHYEEALLGYRKSYEIMANYVDINDLTPLEQSELGKLNLNMGNVYRKTDLSKAGSYLEEAYNTFMDLYGPDDYLSMISLGYKAFYLEETGCLSDAEKTYLDIYERSNDPEQNREMLLLHGEVAHHLGAFYSDYAPDKAMSYLSDAKDIFWNQLSPTHPDTLDVLNSICTLRLQTGDDYESILGELEYLLGLFIDVYGENASNTGTIYNNIGLCYYYLNQYDEAIKNYRIALRISETVNGKGSVDSAYIYNNIGAVYSENGKPQDAIKEHKRALQIYENAFPEKMNLDLAQTYNDLADASLRLGALDSCMDYLNNAFPIYEGMLPENSYKLLSPYSILANLLVEANDFIQAEIIYGHILWLMIENGYEETSASVQEFAARLEEIKALAEKQKETNES